jgi:hypothetical protein
VTQTRRANGRRKNRGRAAGLGATSRQAFLRWYLPATEPGLMRPAVPSDPRAADVPGAHDQASLPPVQAQRVRGDPRCAAVPLRLAAPLVPLDARVTLSSAAAACSCCFSGSSLPTCAAEPATGSKVAVGRFRPGPSLPADPPSEWMTAGYKPSRYCIYSTPHTVRVEMRDFEW